MCTARTREGADVGVMEALLNAQRRPESEAARLADAIAKQLDVDHGGGPDSTAAAISAAVNESCDQINQDIAFEKLPPKQVSDAAMESFGDEATGDEHIADAVHDIAAPLGADAHYRLDDIDDDESTAVGDDSESPAPEEEGADVPREEYPAGWADDTEPEPEPSDDAGIGDIPPSDGEPGVDSGDGGPGINVGDEASDEDSLADGGGAGAYDDEAADDSVGGGEPYTDQAAAPVVAPSPLDAYAAVPSPWDGQEELPIDDSGTDDDAQEPDAGDDADSDGDTDDDIAPEAEATAPPSDIDAPLPSPEAGFKERATDTVRSVVGWVKDNRKKATVYGGIAIALILAIGGLLSAVNGTRGRPPVAKNEIETQPGIDNAEKSPDLKTLIPEEVSASCGNQNDAVGPFSSNKTRAWVCARINGLDLNVLNIIFASPVVIEKICIVPGWDYVAPDGRDEWVRHRLLASVSWRMGGKVYPQKMTPTRPGVCKDFPSVITKEMSMTVTASVRPTVGESKKHSNIADKGDDDIDMEKVDETTAVGSIIIKGHPVNPAGG